MPRRRVAIFDLLGIRQRRQIPPQVFSTRDGELRRARDPRRQLGPIYE
jgi:hypothetical protein